MNAEFQRITRRDKTAFLNEQCKEIEESKRMGQTRDLLKNIGDIKRMFQARMGMIKVRNSKDLREAKGKGERERYTQLNSEFQRITRRDKKAFLKEQCKGIEENNIMGKTRDFFKEIGDIKEAFQARMGIIKD